MSFRSLGGQRLQLPPPPQGGARASSGPSLRVLHGSLGTVGCQEGRDVESLSNAGWVYSQLIESDKEFRDCSVYTKITCQSLQLKTNCSLGCGGPAKCTLPPWPSLGMLMSFPREACSDLSLSLNLYHALFSPWTLFFSLS